MALNILVVDDSATVRAIIKRTLEMSGVPVGTLHQAGNGAEALAVLGKEWVDLVFTDLNMPVMDGVALVEHMNADNMLKTIPVIVVSTDGSAVRIEQLKAKGVRAFVHKPFTPELLRKVVSDTVGV